MKWIIDVRSTAADPYIEALSACFGSDLCRGCDSGKVCMKVLESLPVYYMNRPRNFDISPKSRGDTASM